MASRSRRRLDPAIGVQRSANAFLVLLRPFGLTPVLLVGQVGVPQAAFALRLLDEPVARIALPCLTGRIGLLPCTARRDRQDRSGSTDQAGRPQHPRCS